MSLASVGAGFDPAELLRSSADEAELCSVSQHIFYLELYGEFRRDIILHLHLFI